MCYECWTKLGKPRMRTLQTKRIAELVTQLHDMPDGASGGNLHIVTDDWNLEDNHVEWCRDNVVRIQDGTDRQEYDHTDPVQLAIEREIIDLMLPMSEQERGAALALENGFLNEAVTIDGEVVEIIAELSPPVS